MGWDDVRGVAGNSRSSRSSGGGSGRRTQRRRMVGCGGGIGGRLGRAASLALTWPGTATAGSVLRRGHRQLLVVVAVVSRVVLMVCGSIVAGSTGSSSIAARTANSTSGDTRSNSRSTGSSRSTSGVVLLVVRRRRGVATVHVALVARVSGMWSMAMGRSMGRPGTSITGSRGRTSQGSTCSRAGAGSGPDTRGSNRTAGGSCSSSRCPGIRGRSWSHRWGHRSCWSYR